MLSDSLFGTLRFPSSNLLSLSSIMELVELVVLMGEVTMACRLHRQRGVRWSGLMSGTFLELCSAIMLAASPDFLVNKEAQASPA